MLRTIFSGDLLETASLHTVVKSTEINVFRLLVFFAKSFWFVVACTGTDNVKGGIRRMSIELLVWQIVVDGNVRDIVKSIFAVHQRLNNRLLARLSLLVKLKRFFWDVGQLKIFHVVTGFSVHTNALLDCNDLISAHFLLSGAIVQNGSDPSCVFNFISSDTNRFVTRHKTLDELAKLGKWP